MCSRSLIALWSLQVMKRVRTEHIQMAVSCYLKRRQYVDSDGPLKQGLRLSQTPEEMAANLTGNHGAAQGRAGAGALRSRPRRNDFSVEMAAQSRLPAPRVPRRHAVLRSQARGPLVKTPCRDGACARPFRCSRYPQALAPPRCCPGPWRQVGGGPARWGRWPQTV